LKALQDVHTKRLRQTCKTDSDNFVSDFLQAKCDSRRKTADLRFELRFGDLGATIGPLESA